MATGVMLLRNGSYRMNVLLLVFIYCSIATAFKQSSLTSAPKALTSFVTSAAKRHNFQGGSPCGGLLAREL